MHGLLNRRDALMGLGLCGLGSMGTASPTEGKVYRGFKGTEVRFAAVEVGQAILGTNDAWISSTSDFQRTAIMQKPGPISLQDFIEWNRQAVQPWRDDQRARWLSALKELAPAFNALRIPLPRVVHLISSTGQESSGAAYTRANAVTLTTEDLPSGFTDAKLLAHELWHVAARHSPKTASRLYAEIGFWPMPDLLFPKQWQAIRIANPDAPGHSHAMRLQIDGRSTWITPVMVASRTQLKPLESFFDVMEVRLLEVTPGRSSGPSLAVIQEGEPRWHPVDGRHNYLEQLGGNTDYVNHYEEVMADNVALLAVGAHAHNPSLLGRLRAVLLHGAT
jgi:hypothetical protein